MILDQPPRAAHGKNRGVPGRTERLIQLGQFRGAQHPRAPSRDRRVEPRGRRQHDQDAARFQQRRGLLQRPRVIVQVLEHTEQQQRRVPVVSRPRDPRGCRDGRSATASGSSRGSPTRSRSRDSRSWRRAAAGTSRPSRSRRRGSAPAAATRAATRRAPRGRTALPTRRWLRRRRRNDSTARTPPRTRGRAPPRSGTATAAACRTPRTACRCRRLVCRRTRAHRRMPHTIRIEPASQRHPGISPPAVNAPGG